MAKEYLKATRGAVNELKATVWLLDQGYQVFRNVMPCGDADIVAIRAGEILLIDVKTISCTKLKNGARYYIINKKRHEELAGRGVKTLCYMVDMDKFIWVEEALALRPKAL